MRMRSTLASDERVKKEKERAKEGEKGLRVVFLRAISHSLSLDSAFS